MQLPKIDITRPELDEFSFLLCIDSAPFEVALTVGKSYNSILEIADRFLVVCDDGRQRYLLCERFNRVPLTVKDLIV